MDKAKLIVIEGLDGSGKSTQFEIIGRYFKDKGVPCKAISFPEYDKPSSALVKMYLNGDFSKNAEEINAYAASSFYAVDRYASYKLYWEKNYKNGELILAARYVTSNAIYQMEKLPEDEWKSYLEWLSDYEYDKLGLPRPDMVIYLDMPVDVSQKLLLERYKGDESKKDIHEGNIKFLNNCRKAALFTAERQGWEIISCSENGCALSIEAISKAIKERLENIKVD